MKISRADGRCIVSESFGQLGLALKCGDGADGRLVMPDPSLLAVVRYLGSPSRQDTIKDLLANGQVRVMLPAAVSTLGGMKLDAGMLGILGEQALESVLLGLFGGDLQSPQVAILNRELQRIPR